MKSASAIHQAEVPSTRSWSVLREAARDCRACPLYLKGTQTVFGEGPKRSDIVFIGEQPGDQEDLAGRPFIGPAGGLLNRALETAGIDRSVCYVTNAVKHFKWEARGKRRLHEKPNAGEIKACSPWWQAELRLIRPAFLVCLGGTAAKAVMGRPVKVLTERGSLMPSEWAEQTLVTVHPSSLLRMPDKAAREAAFQKFVEDLSLLRASSTKTH